MNFRLPGGDLPALSLPDDTAPYDNDTPRKVLMIVHGPGTPPGKIGQWLKSRGYSLDIRCPRFGDALPETLADHAGAVIFGGSMSVNDPDAYIRRELDWLAVPLKQNKPVFGICLGAQMLAKHLGGEVGPRSDGMVECGYTRIEADKTIPASAIPMDWPSHVYHWHKEGFSLPWGAQRLASSGLFENQAFRYGHNAFGVQFHPEATLSRILHVTIRAAGFLSLPGAQSRAEHIAGHDAHGHKTLRWLDGFMRVWINAA